MIVRAFVLIYARGALTNGWGWGKCCQTHPMWWERGRMCHKGMEALEAGVSEEPVKRTAEDRHREELSAADSLNASNRRLWDPSGSRSTCAVSCIRSGEKLDLTPPCLPYPSHICHCPPAIEDIISRNLSLVLLHTDHWTRVHTESSFKREKNKRSVPW